MQNAIDLRAITSGKYIVEHNCTIRTAAKEMNISKSTLHNDVHNRLKYIDYNLYLCVDKVLRHNFDMRHIRGGESTRIYYLQKKSSEMNGYSKEK